MLLSEYDRVVCLCVDKRFNQERGRIQDLVLQHGIDPARFRFLLDGEGNLFPPKFYWQITPLPPSGWQHGRGAFAHFSAMQKAVKEAKDAGVEHLLWLEDDVVLTHDFDEVVAKATNQLAGEVAPFDLLYYGANHTWTTTQDISENVLRCYGSLTTHCVGISSSIFDAILNLPAVHVIDKVIADTLHHTRRCYAIWPAVALQKPGYSYLSNMETDYNHYFKCKGANRV